MSSLASLLAQWFRPPAAAPPRSPPPFHAGALTAQVDPCADRGLPAIAVAEVIAPHAEWLRRLRYAYGAPQAEFDRDIGSVVERYARYVHLLPATPATHFRGPGGLFRMGLEIGFFALQAADGAIFSGRQTITVRAALEPRWRYATFLAGLCSGLCRSLGHLTVSNDRGDAWPPYLQPLAPWLQDTKSQRYHLRWLPNPEANRALGVVAVSHIVAPAILQHLAQGNAAVIPHFMASVSGTALGREANTLDQLVQRAATLVIERDLQTNVEPSAAPPRHSHRFERSDATIQAAPQPSPRAFPAPDLAADAVARPVALIAPARLHPAVRDALRQIITTLDSSTAPPAAVVMASGVFVPLREFEHRNVDPALAVRALSAALMLACDPSQPQAKTCARSFDEQTVLGVLLAPGCISGLHEHAFRAVLEARATPC